MSPHIKYQTSWYFSADDNAFSICSTGQGTILSITLKIGHDPADLISKPEENK
jgi:hypothetical protein